MKAVLPSDSYFRPTEVSAPHCGEDWGSREAPEAGGVAGGEDARAGGAGGPRAALHLLFRPCPCALWTSVSSVALCELTHLFFS